MTETLAPGGSYRRDKKGGLKRLDKPQKLYPGKSNLPKQPAAATPTTGGDAKQEG